MNGLVGGIEQKLFRFVATRKNVAEAVEDVGELKRQVMVNLIASVLLLVVPIGIWQAAGKKSQWIVFGAGIGSLIAVERANKVNGRIPGVAELKQVERHVKTEREKQRIVEMLRPELASVKIRGGIEGSLVLALQNQGIEVDSIGTVKAPQFNRVKILPRGEVQIEDIKRLEDRLKIALGIDQPPIVTVGKDWWNVDLQRLDRQFCPIDKHLIDGFYPSGKPVTIPLGIDVEGKLQTVELSDPNTAHWIVGGQTGAGKSELERSWIRWWMQWHPRDIQIVVIDPKQVTFADFEEINRVENLAAFTNVSKKEVYELFPDVASADDFARQFKAWLPMGVIKDSGVAAKAFNSVLVEMHERYDLFSKIGVSNLEECNSRLRRLGKETIPRLVVMCDEYFMLISNDGDKKAIEKELKPLLAMARASGITFIFATQRPSVETFSMMIRSNCGGRIAMLMDANSSAITLDRMDQDGGDIASKLLGKGDMWVKQGSNVERMQSLYWDGKHVPQTVDIEEPNSQDDEPLAVEQEIEVVKEVEQPQLKSSIQPTVEVKSVIASEPQEAPVMSDDDFRNQLNRQLNRLVYEVPAATRELALEQPIQSVQPVAEVQPELKDNDSKQLYLEYRAWREAGKAPYKFVEAKFKRGSAENREAFERQIAGWLREWVLELSGSGRSAEEVVKVIWNYAPTKAKPDGDEKFQGAMEFINSVIGVRADGKQEK